MTLEERVAALEKIVGNFSIPADMAHPPAELPNGEYPIAFRQKQLGYATDAAVKTVGEFDARLKALENTPAGTADVKAGLAAYDIHIAPGKLSIGWEVDDETQAPLQLGGRVAAEIQGRSNVNKTDGQNPNEPHINTLVVCDNDGGARLRQYMKWFNGKVRNTTNRPGSIFAIFDSMGDTCISDDRWAVGQFWYWVKSSTRGLFATYQPGVKIEIAESSSYASIDQKRL